MARSLLIAALWLVVVVAAAIGTAAQPIQACADGQSGNIDITYPSFTVTRAAWGNRESAGCMANAITGLSSITSFTYYLKLETAYAPFTASAIVVNASSSASYGAVASVDISQLVPTALFDVRAVTATFASPVALDPQRTYFLAICAYAPGDIRVGYSLQANREVTAEVYCTQDPETCTSASGLWVDSKDVLKTIISGGCASPSPSHTPSNSPTPSTSPSISPSPSFSPSPSPSNSPSPSASPSPARGSAERLTPGKAFGAPAVRFLLGLRALFFR
jgi:hypothetical protein